MDDDFPRIVTRDQLRFDISFALGQMPPSLWRAWVLGKQYRSEFARAQIVERILARFDRYQVKAPPPIPAHSFDGRTEFHNPPSGSAAREKKGDES